LSETAYLSWDEFVEELMAAVPGRVGAHVTASSPIVRPSGDKVAKAAIHRGLRRLLPGAPEDLLESISTVGEAYDWYKLQDIQALRVEAGSRGGLRVHR
jgi:hypothetical protein